LYLSDGQPDVVAEAAQAISYLFPIALEPWQEKLVVSHPDQFVRGCIHSDGRRHRRIVRGKNYPAYGFSNRSNDLLNLFAWACRLLEIRHTRSSRIAISIARRPDVARLDAIMARSWSESPDRATVLD